MPRSLPPAFPRLPLTSSDPLVPIIAERKNRSLPASRIRHVTACENYSDVTLADGQRLLVRRTMREWMRLLPGTQFARVHRGLILNLARIGPVDRNRRAIVLHFTDPGAEPLKLSPRHWPGLRDRVAAWRQTRAAGPAVAQNSIGVLPFVNLSGRRTDEAFCDGLTEELLNVLAQVRGLRVAARTSLFHFKHRTLPVTEIARQLGVAFVVEGSIRCSGRKVRITAHLIAAATGFRVWSDTFDRDRRAVFAAQDEIAAVLVRNLQLTLAPALRASPDFSAAARRLVLEGRHFWNLRTSDGFVRAEDCFRRAVALEPGFAVAHAALAELSVVRAMYRLADGDRDAGEDLRLTRSSARRALELEPGCAEALSALAFAFFHEGRFAESTPLFTQAIAANPNYANAYQFFAWSLAGAGQLAAALRVYEQAITLDPLSFINLDRYAAMLFLARRHEDALRENDRAAALRPDPFVGNLAQRAAILLALGRGEEAAAEARRVRELSRTASFRRNADAEAIFVLQQRGATAEAADFANEVLCELSSGNYRRGFVLGALGRFEEAVPFLEATPPILLSHLYWSPLWDAVRGRPTFRRLIRRLGRQHEYRLARGQLAV